VNVCIRTKPYRKVQRVEKEAKCKYRPEFDVVPAFAFVVEAVDPVHGGTFMIPSEDEEILGVHDLVREEEADRLKRLLASVYVIAACMESKRAWERIRTGRARWTGASRRRVPPESFSFPPILSFLPPDSPKEKIIALRWVAPVFKQA
jgi:hypothetical protein